MASTQTTLTDRLTASAALIDSGLEEAAEPALNLQIAIDQAGNELIKVAGAMEQRQIAGNTDADRQHLARIRKAVARVRDALAAYDALNKAVRS